MILEHDWDKRDSGSRNDKVNASLSGDIVQSQKDYQASMEAFLANLSLEAINKNIKEVLSSDYFLIVGMDDNEDVQRFWLL